jgi:uncharacterized membrane protein YraQ (UPF0718 family)
VLREVMKVAPTENTENSNKSGFETVYIYVIVGVSVAVIVALVVGIVYYKKKISLREFEVDSENAVHNNKVYLYDF